MEVVIAKHGNLFDPREKPDIKIFYFCIKFGIILSKENAKQKAMPASSEIIGLFFALLLPIYTIHSLPQIALIFIMALI